MTFSWFERFLYTNVYFDDFLMGWGKMEAKITILSHYSDDQAQGGGGTQVTRGIGVYLDDFIIV